ncbi:MAG: YtxH domain-containing protein [Acidimicrobiia bacterium]
MGKKLRFLFGALTGALIQYLFDPQAGKYRRARVGDRTITYMDDVRKGIDRRSRGINGQPADAFTPLGKWRTARIHVSNEQPYYSDEAPRIV